MSFKQVGASFACQVNVDFKTESPIEKLLLFAFLRNKEFVLVDKVEPTGAGLFIYPQKEVGPYRADFIIEGVGYKSGKRVFPPNKTVSIAVECDGAEFHVAGNEHDQKRDKYFAEQGIKTFRYTGSEIYNSGDLIASDIAAYLNGEIFRP